MNLQGGDRRVGERRQCGPELGQPLPGHGPVVENGRNRDIADSERPYPNFVHRFIHCRVPFLP